MTKHTGFEVKKREMSVQAILEWAFRNEGASLELPEEFEVMLGRGYGAGTWLRMAHLEALGCHVDGGGRSDPHEDAEVVAAIVSNLSDAYGGKFMAVRVAEIARAGLTPDWMPGAAPRILPAQVKGDGMSATERCGRYREAFKKVDRRGRTRTRYKDHDIRFCPVVVNPTQGQIDRARSFYAEWWLALSEIKRGLQAAQRLRRHKVTDRMPIMIPWKET